MRARVDFAAGKLRDMPFYYVQGRGEGKDFARLKIEEFANMVGMEEHNGKMRRKPCVVFYDWLKMAEGDSRSAEKEYQELGFIATALKDCANIYDVPLIAGSQANRGGAEKGVAAKSAAHAESFLADSDRILRFCDALIWLRRLNPDEMADARELPPELQHNQMLHVVDHRGGETCLHGICLNFKGETLSYEQVPYTNLSHYHETGEITGDPYPPRKKKKPAEKPKGCKSGAKMSAEDLENEVFGEK